LKNGHYTVNHLKRFVRSSNFPPAERYQSFVSIFRGEERRSLLPGLNGFSKCDENLAFFSNGRMGLLDQALNQDIHTYLPEDILALSDRLSMWHSLELRVPFVDHKLVEFCAAIPASLKIRGREKKVLLRRAARGVLPDSVLDHRKQGFAAPMAAWLRGDLKEYVADSLSTSTVARHGLFDPKYVQTILHDHWDRRELNDRKIFSVLMFQRWLDTAAAAR
jgi:asparagine synthase (glutamine-hydrolysing)